MRRETGATVVVFLLILASCETRTTVKTPPPTPAPIAAAPETPAPEPAAETDAARGLLDELELAWRAGDVDTVRRLYAPTATVRVETGQHARTLTLDEYIDVAVRSRAMLEDYRYRVDDARLSTEDGVVKAHVNVIEDGREGDRAVHSEADVTYTIEMFEGHPRVSSTVARVVTAVPESPEGWDHGDEG